MKNFKLTKEELEQARSGGFAQFKSGEEYTFLVKGVKEREMAGKVFDVFDCQVIGGDQDGKKHGMWFSDNQASQDSLTNLIRAFFTDEEITSEEGVDPTEIIGRQFKSAARNSTGSNGKTYTNFYSFAEVSDVPDMEAPSQEMDAADIPF